MINYTKVNSNFFLSVSKVCASLICSRGIKGYLSRGCISKGVFVLGSKAYIPLLRKIPGVGGWHWAMPPTPEFCVGDTIMLVYLALGEANLLRWPCIFLFFCVDFIRVGYPMRTPFPVEYRWRWVPNAKVSRWPCTFHVFCVDFIRVW